MSGLVRLSYRDEDGDEITVSSNREVLDAIQSCSSAVKILKFNVRDVRGESMSDTSEPNSPVKEVCVCLVNTLSAYVFRCLWVIAILAYIIGSMVYIYFLR